MKKLFLLIVLFFTSFGFVFITNAGWAWGNRESDIYTKDNPVNDDGLDDPVREGTYSISKGMQGVVEGDEDNVEDAQGNFMLYVAKWLNYFLGLLAMITIIYIIKDGITIVTASADETRQKEATKNIKNYILAIIGIGLAALVVNLILYFVNYNTP